MNKSIKTLSKEEINTLNELLEDIESEKNAESFLVPVDYISI